MQYSATDTGVKRQIAMKQKPKARFKKDTRKAERGRGHKKGKSSAMAIRANHLHTSSK